MQDEIGEYFSILLDDDSQLSHLHFFKVAAVKSSRSCHATMFPEHSRLCYAFNIIYYTLLQDGGLLTVQDTLDVNALDAVTLESPDESADESSDASSDADEPADDFADGQGDVALLAEVINILFFVFIF